MAGKMSIVLSSLGFVVGFVVFTLLAFDRLPVTGQQFVWFLGGAVLTVVPYGTQVALRVRQLPQREEIMEADIERVWRSRTCDHAIAAVREAIDACRAGDQVLLAGVSLHDFLHVDSRYYSSINDSLARGASLKVVLTDPLGEAAIDRARSEESFVYYSDSPLFKAVARSMATLAKMEENYPDKVDVAFYRQPCRWFMVKAGHALFYAGYRLAPVEPSSAERASGVLGPFLQCRSGGSVWQSIMKDFNYLFDRYRSNTLPVVREAMAAMGLADEQGVPRPQRNGFGLDEKEWVDKHGNELAQYADRWVAVSAQGKDVAVVTYGDSLDKVLQTAAQQGISKPFVVNVPSRTD